MYSVGLQLGAQVLIGPGGHSDHATKPWSRLIEDEGLSGPVADRATTFFDEQDTGSHIPFVFRLDGEGGLDATSGN
jgi:hypothetical protein